MKPSRTAIAPARKPAAAFARPKADTTINVRVSKGWRDLIDNAASALGKTRTDFIVDSARRQAIDILLDRRLFSLENDQYRVFVKALNAPPPPSARLKKLMRMKAPWDA